MTRLATIVLLSAGLSARLSATALAQPKPADTAEAGKRFSAGVALYNEADYRAALVEFQRAYEIAPSPVVLYNIGEAQYQLQDYAAAYLTLTQFLRETPPDADHRGEVEATVQQLQSRIGKFGVTADVVGAEVSIDGIVVGKTPLAPMLVSVGRRHVTITAPGRFPWTRDIDVAANDSIRQEVTLQAEQPVVTTSLPTTPAREREPSSKLPAVLWTATGVLAVGTITFGVLAWSASNKLDDLRGQYPVTREQLDDQSDKVKLYSHLADGLGGATVAVGVTALVFTLVHRHSPRVAEHASIGLGPRGLVVGGNF